MLVVISGLPGTGKTTVARAVAEQLSAVHLSIDEVEDALLGAGLERGWTTGVAAYEVVRVLAESNLTLGRTVVVDAVNDSEPARATWPRAARAAGVDVRFVVLVATDEERHRQRLESRGARFSHLPEPTWQDVRARATTCEPWVGDHVTIDADQPLAQVVRLVLEAVSRED
jgi:predicted kinase